jgi:hypothetical protein
MSSDVIYVTNFDSNELPSEPPEARKSFKHAAIKDKIWSNMKEKLKFRPGAEDVVKNAMFINMGRLFHKWKFELNMNYVKNGLVPKHMGKIIEAQ